MPDILSEVLTLCVGQKSMLPSTAPTSGNTIEPSDASWHSLRGRFFKEFCLGSAQLHPWLLTQGELLCLCISLPVPQPTNSRCFSKTLAFYLLRLVTPSLCLESSPLPCDKQCSRQRARTYNGDHLICCPSLQDYSLSDYCSGFKTVASYYTAFSRLQV